jgi:hypothetical protein
MRPQPSAILSKPVMHSQPNPERVAVALCGRASGASAMDGETNVAGAISNIASKLPAVRVELVEIRAIS